MNELIGQLIREMRREKEFTMVNFAKKIGVSQPTLSRIENGSQEVSLTFLSKVCEELNIPMGEFFSRLDGNGKLQNLELSLMDTETSDISDMLDTKLHKMISTLTDEQKKGLYVLLLPYIQE